MLSTPTIPLFFFDLIGRVVPGSVALAVFRVAAPASVQTSAGRLLHDLGAGPPASSAASALAWAGIAYIVGHLLAPLSKGVVLVLRRVFGARRSGTPPIRWFVCPDRQRDGLVPTEPWTEYDWLRVHGPQVSDFATRIRAEYTLHFALAVVFAGGAVLSIVSASEREWDATLVWVFSFCALSALCSWRGGDLTASFRNLVLNLCEALRDSPKSRSSTDRTG